MGTGGDIGGYIVVLEVAPASLAAAPAAAAARTPASATAESCEAARSALPSTPVVPVVVNEAEIGEHPSEGIVSNGKLFLHRVEHPCRSVELSSPLAKPRRDQYECPHDGEDDQHESRHRAPIDPRRR